MCPRCAAVGGLVDAVADRQVGTVQSFAAGDVDDIGIGGRNLDGADRAGCFMIEDRRPGPAEIGGLPYAAVHRADVEDIRLAGHTRDCTGAASAKRPDVAPMQLAQQVWGSIAGFGLEERSQGLQTGEGRTVQASFASSMSHHEFVHHENGENTTAGPVNGTAERASKANGLPIGNGERPVRSTKHRESVIYCTYLCRGRGLSD